MLDKDDVDYFNSFSVRKFFKEWPRRVKSLYRHNRSGDIFAIEIGELGNVRSTSGPLFSDDLDPKLLDYDEYQCEAYESKN